jgi:soluble lytic murein transglycosylase-like protein
LLEARARFRAGKFEDAATRALSTSTPQGAMLAGMAFVVLADDARAASAFTRVPQGHVLANPAAEALVGIYRRQGNLVLAQRVARELSRRGVPSAPYLEADVQNALAGCAATPAYQKALRASPSHEGRHAARRNLLACASTPSEKAGVALDMLDDAEPLDGMLARAALQDVVDHPDDARPLSKDLSLRVADRLLMERLPALTAAVVERLPATPNVEESMRRSLLLAAAYGQLGRKPEKLKILQAVLSSKVGAESPGVWRSVLAARASDMEPRELAQKNLEIAEKFPEDPLSIENRHLAGYYYAEAGELSLALAQWDLVASQANPKQKDAAWFKAKTLAALGRLADASQSAAEWAHPTAVGTERATHLKYWSGLWLKGTGKEKTAAAQLKDLCEQYPARLYGRLACARAGVTGAALAGVPPPLPEDAFQALLSLAGDKALSSTSRDRLVKAAALYQSAAWELARQEVRAVVQHEKADAATMLALGELALMVGDPTSAVQLAERRRGDVDGLKNPRWHRVAYPRVAAVEAAATSEGMDEDLVLAIARTESFFSPSVRSKAGAMGVMQLMPGTAAQLKTDQDADFVDGALFDSGVNATFGSRYLKLLRADFGARVELLACGYNAGPGNARKFVERGKGLPLDMFLDSINFRETRGYAKRVLEAYLNYRAGRGLAADVDPDMRMDVVPGTSTTF